MKIVARPIDTIAIFRRGTHPMPRKFRFAREDGSLQEVQVDRVLSVEPRRIAGIPTLLYDCQSVLDQVEHRYQLKYLIGDCRWELYKW